MSDRREHSTCPAETVLEEFALGRLEAGKAATAAAHVRTCAVCAGLVDQLRAEGRLLADALAAHVPLVVEGCMEDDILAQYLDRSLGETERAAAEEHLAVCRRCQARLVAIDREWKALQGTEAVEEASSETARYEHEGPAAAPAVPAPEAKAPHGKVQNIYPSAKAAGQPRRRPLVVALLAFGGGRVCGGWRGVWPVAYCGVGSSP